MSGLIIGGILTFWLLYKICKSDSKFTKDEPDNDIRKPFE